MSLFSQLKESYPNPNKVCNNSVEIPKKEESLKPEHMEIQKVDTNLTKSMKNHEVEGIESKEFDHDFLLEEDEVQYKNEVVFLFPCKDRIPIVNTSPTLVLVYLKFQQLYHVSMR